MSFNPSVEGEPASRFWRIHSYVLIFLACTLSVTIILKIGEIQYLELILAADFVLLMGLFAWNRFRTRMFRPFFSIGQSYVFFLALVFLLALFALRQQFNPANETFLKQPLLVTISRMAELILDVFYMLYLASLFREDRRLCLFGAKVYYWTGIAGGLYALATYPLNFFLHLQLGTYGDSHRLRGFDNEGGPYGTYLISVCALVFVMYRQGWLSRRQFYWSISFLIVCLIGSQSKAAFFAMGVLGVFYLILALRGWRRWTVLATLGAAFAVLGLALDIPAKVQVYNKASGVYEEMSNLKSGDPNFVMGRVAGAVLAPRMIAAHPLAGIGWGNYPLVRDDPEYRQGTAFSFGSTDAPGLGLIDYIVDLGFPLCLYLIWILSKPAFLLHRSGARVELIAMAAIQPIATLAGAHLNLIYSWVVVALALGIGFGRWPAIGRQSGGGPSRP
jgi:hypothetical protein